MTSGSDISRSASANRASICSTSCSITPRVYAAVSSREARRRGRRRARITGAAPVRLTADPRAARGHAEAPPPPGGRRAGARLLLAALALGGAALEALHAAAGVHELLTAR